MIERIDNLEIAADITAIVDRSKILAGMICKVEELLRTAPKESIRVSTSNGSTQYYSCADENDRYGKYIRKKDRLFATQLANKKYHENLLSELIREKDIIDKFIKEYNKVNLESAYTNLNDKIKNLIAPVTITDEEYISCWLNDNYIGKEIDIETQFYLTDKNEKVRSKSEVIIANTLNKNGIPYKYEKPLRVNRYTFYPDFTVLNVRKRKEIYFEHLGMMGNEDYSSRSVWKTNQYTLAGFIPGRDVVFSQETQEDPLNQQVLQILINNYFR